MAIKVTIIFAIALSSLLSSLHNVEGTSRVDELCLGSQFPNDCSDSIPKYLENPENPTHNDILLAGLKVIAERADEGIKAIEKLKSETDGIDAARLGMVQAYYNMIFARSNAAIVSLKGEDFGSLEYELDYAVKTTYECFDLLPKDSPVQEYTRKIHMASKNNISFGNFVGSE
ncbi:hypothetical protein AB3S75_016043 [Citrus x aurantiifolia]